jgi:hypothetical protein
MGSSYIDCPSKDETHSCFDMLVINHRKVKVFHGFTQSLHWILKGLHHLIINITSVKLTTHLHLVPRSRMSGAIPPFPLYIFMAWCLVKHRDNFTLLYLVAVVACRKQLQLQSGDSHPTWSRASSYEWGFPLTLQKNIKIGHNNLVHIPINSSFTFCSI